MVGSQQAIFVLQLVLAVGPIAVYFLGLGLANSRPHPVLVKARSDFTLLAIAFLPLVVWPTVSLLGRGYWPLSVLILLASLAAVILVMPRRDAGWVLYNVSPRQCARLLARAVRRCGWEAEAIDGRPESGQIVDGGRLRIEQENLPVLRNASIRLVGAVDGTPRQVERMTTRLIEALHVETQQESLLPSPTGASLVLIGAGLLVLPLWCLVTQMDVIVEAVVRILLA